MTGIQTSALLGSFISEQEDRLVKRVMADLKYALDEGASRQERKESVASFAGRLGSLLLERGEQAAQLWAEEVRHHGGAFYQERREIGDLVREFSVLERAVLDEWIKRVGPISEDVAGLLAECISEGIAASTADYVRCVRAQQAPFGESRLVGQILENLDEGLLLIESDRTFSLATRPAFELLGSQLNSTVGRSIDDPSFASFLGDLKAQTLEGALVHPRDLPISYVLKTGQMASPILLKVDQGGRERILEFGAIPIAEEQAESSGNELRGVIGTIRDRTAEVERAEELRNANRELAALHGRLLHRSRAQAMGELASGAAHALNNLLNSMRLRLRLLRESPGPEKVEALGRAVDGTADLVTWLQQFVSQRTPGPIESADLDALLRDSITLVRPEAQRPGGGSVRLGLKLGDPERVKANPSELREILVSLLLYIRDQLGAGGSLDVATGVEQEKVFCKLAFRADVGAPSRPEEWFEPSQGSAGSPLALAALTAREALHRWGGGLEVSSMEAGGARFSLAFEPSAAKQKPGISAGATSEHRRVLVVDDDADNAGMLAEVLSAEGHSAETATSGKEAIEKWKHDAFDVALIDFLMPDMSGIEIAAKLFAERPEARIALVTGWDLDENQQREANVRAIFRKPVDIELLLGFLRHDKSQEKGGPESRRAHE